MKRIVSVLLCVLFLFSLSVPAFAEGDVINNYTNETDLTPVTSWLRDLYDSLNERLTHVGNNIAEGFNALYDTLRTVMDNVKTAITNSIDAFKTAMKNLLEEVKARIKAVENYVSYVYTRIQNIYDDFKQKAIEKIEYYFVPTFSMQAQVEEWKELLLTKFSCFEQISNAFSELFTMKETDEPPSFPITYRGVTVGLIDFRPYDSYRPFVHMLILGFAWYAYLRRVFYWLPGFIMGASYSGSSRNDRPVDRNGKG